MLRVVARHVQDAGSVLIGDFPPSEIPALLELAYKHPVYFWEPEAEGNHEDAVLNETPAQFVTMGGKGAPRLGLEILFDN